MIWMPMYIHVIFSYLAAVGFAVFLNSPKKTLYVAGSIGTVSYTHLTVSYKKRWVNIRVYR